MPLLARDTIPSEPEHEQMSEPTVRSFRRDAAQPIEAAVSPPREARSTDVSITKVSVPLPMQAAIIAAAILIASQLWRLDSSMDNMQALFEARDKYEARYQTLLEEKLSLQIENAGLRTSAMDLATALAAARASKGR